MLKTVLCALLVFGCLSRQLAAQNKPAPTDVEKARRAAIDDYSSGKEYLSRDGMKEAEADIEKGIPKYKEYGRRLAEPYRQARDKVFLQRFGIQHEPIAGCFIQRTVGCLR
ncbi:MAG: hypothetical protein QM760_09605 [Nibricoccus sp.]